MGAKINKTKSRLGKVLHHFLDKFLGNFGGSFWRPKTANERELQIGPKLEPTLRISGVWWLPKRQKLETVEKHKLLEMHPAKEREG